jgi:hypothetical protein
LRIVDCGSSINGAAIVDCGSPDRRLQIADCRLPTADCRLPIAALTMALDDFGFSRQSTIRNRQSINPRSSIVNPSVANRRSPIR